MSLRLALLLAALGAAWPHSHHPCARVAEGRPSAPFLSTCHAASGLSSLHEAALFVCLPLSAVFATPLRADLDPLSRTLSPDSFVGRLAREGAALGASLYALQFEEAAAIARAADGGVYRCTRGSAHGLEPGEYTAEVVVRPPPRALQLSAPPLTQNAAERFSARVLWI